jgi:hypothetical protein
MSITPLGISALAPNFTLPPVPPAPNEGVPDETFHFNHLGSDIVLQSCDSHNFRVPKLYIVFCSPVLRNLIQGASNTADVLNGEEQEPPLPLVKLLESKATLYNLLSFIFPVTPVLPHTAEKIVELLAVAKKYQMDSVMSHIRNAISRQDPHFIRPEAAFQIFFFAQENELHQEAVQAARLTLALRFPMTIEGWEDKLDFPGFTAASLHELWKYHERVRADLKSALIEFRSSGLPDNVKSLQCTSPKTNACFPQWIDDYINSMAETPHLIDLFEFENTWVRHIRSHIYSFRKHASYGTCSCASIPSQVIRSIWEALTSVVHRTMEKVHRIGVTRHHCDSSCEYPQADSTLTRVKEQPTSENPPIVPLCLDVPDASIILQSSDQANFRVHKSVLAISSPFFKDLLFLPQSPDNEMVDGLPVIALPEDAELLNSLISLLYPIPLVIPDSYQKVFTLLAVCQKYEMESVQSSIRAVIKLGTFPAPVATEGFSAYAIASSMGLVPEMEDAARLTQGQPMTFESLGEGLRLFKGRALYDLIRNRRGTLGPVTNKDHTFDDGVF